MNFKSYFITSAELQPWIRVDLEELYHIHEVVIWLRHDCCSSTKHDIAVRAGRWGSEGGAGKGLSLLHIEVVRRQSMAEGEDIHKILGNRI